MFQIFVQALGFGGLAGFFLSFQIKSNKALFGCQTFAACMFCLQFLLLGGLTGALNQVVMIIRNGLMTQYHRWEWLKWRGWPYVFTVVCAIIVVFSWNGWTSLLPFVATSVSNFLFFKNSAKAIRVGNLVCLCPCWITYDIIYGSIGGIINELFILSSIIISIYRFGWKHLGELDRK